jgi:predicted transglutaminase-like cysteine proteinase
MAAMTRLPWHATVARVPHRLAWALALALATVVVAAPDFDRLLSAFSQRWGGASPMQRYVAWREMVLASDSGTEPERLKRVNEFFNRHIVFGEDATIWGQADYWATPLETLGRGAGDCEDFAIAKYFSLRMLGVAPHKLRLIYVRARTGGGDAVPTQAHMVLAYYAQPDAEPLVLDNLLGDIRLASRRPDLTPVFSFNSEGVFVGAAAKDAAAPGGLARLSRWEDLLRRAHAEGFE